jgi:hypothetical protein
MSNTMYDLCRFFACRNEVPMYSEDADPANRLRAPRFRLMAKSKSMPFQ